jgi:hypothetical protein
MSAAAARHTGLPFVPRPAPDELLGSWLLRLAQLYGQGLPTLLSRLGARPPGDAHLPHWFSIDSSTINLDALAAAARLPRVDLEAMASPRCRPRWPEELGACETCLADAMESGQPITWNRTWMNPLAVVCRVHGTWLTSVQTRTLARVRHAGDLGSVVRLIALAQALPNDETARASDALWLQDLCGARTDVRLPWGRTRPTDLARIVDGVARAVISASNSDDSAWGPSADRRALVVKDFALEPTADQRVVTSLPTRLRQRQWVLARVAHVLRWAPEARTLHSSWSPASVQWLASMRGWPIGALAWACPSAAKLVRRQEELQREFSISPRYFKAHSALLAAIR